MKKIKLKEYLKMKKLKNFLILTFVFCLAISSIMQASAADLCSEYEANKNIAYMDINTAPKNMVESILNARFSIIYGDQAWTVNGAVKIINEDGTAERLPEFSELFPGWDLPIIDTTSSGTIGPQAIGYSGAVELFVASSTKLSDPFYTFTGDGDEIWAYATSLPGERYNLGFLNEDTNTSEAWVPNLKLYKPNGDYTGATLTTDDDVRYSVRASVFDEDDTGWSNMKVKKN